MVQVANKVCCAYDFLAQSREVRRDCDLFYRATGLSVMLLPADSNGDYRILTGPRHSLCKLITQTGHKLTVCQRFAQPLPANQHHPLVRHCPTGMIEVAVPVLVNQQPVAQLLCGKVFSKPQTRQDFDRVWNRLRQLKLPLKRKPTAQAFFQTDVRTAKQVQAAAELLGQMAHRFATATSRWLAQSHVTEPACVQLAKDLLETRLAEKFTTRQAALAAHVSEQYFCRAFKMATGKTFTAYVARRRIDRAEQLLADPSTRIVDVSLAVGFESLTHFGRVFKRMTGVTAMAYRQALLSGENPSKEKRIPA